MNLVLLGVMAYVLLQLGIGAFVSRRTSNEADYLLAGRRLGLPMTTMTIFATWFGAETCIGASGAVYSEGLSGSRADPFGYALCILLFGSVFAAALWRRKLTTIADLFRNTYGAKVEKLAVLLMAPTSLLWAAAQIRAFGQVLSASSDLSVTIAITIAASVVILYTVMGGLLADAVTDFVQGLVLIIGLIVLFGMVCWFDLNESVVKATLTPERLSLSAHGEPWFARLEAWSIPIFGSLFAQELVARALAARSPQVARSGAFIAAGVYVVVGLMPISLGLLGPALVPGLEDGEQLLPLLAKQVLHPVLYTLFAGAIISAIQSTVDSALLAAASLTSHNLIVPVFRVTDEGMKVRIARSFVVIFGIVAYIIAMYAQGVYHLVEEASAFGSGGLFVVVLFAMGTRIGGTRSAAASLIAGVAAYVLCNYGLGSDYPFLLSIAAAAVAYGAVSLVERRDETHIQESSIA